MVDPAESKDEMNMVSPETNDEVSAEATKGPESTPEEPGNWKAFQNLASETATVVNENAAKGAYAGTVAMAKGMTFVAKELLFALSPLTKGDDDQSTVTRETFEMAEESFEQERYNFEQKSFDPMKKKLRKIKQKRKSLAKTQRKRDNFHKGKRRDTFDNKLDEALGLGEPARLLQELAKDIVSDMLYPVRSPSKDSALFDSSDDASEASGEFVKELTRSLVPGGDPEHAEMVSLVESILEDEEESNQNNKQEDSRIVSTEESIDSSSVRIPPTDSEKVFRAKQGTPVKNATDVYGDLVRMHTLNYIHGAKDHGNKPAPILVRRIADRQVTKKIIHDKGASDFEAKRKKEKKEMKKVLQSQSSIKMATQQDQTATVNRMTETGPSNSQHERKIDMLETMKQAFQEQLALAKKVVNGPGAETDVNEPSIYEQKRKNDILTMKQALGVGTPEAQQKETEARKQALKEFNIRSLIEPINAPVVEMRNEPPVERIAVEQREPNFTTPREKKVWKTKQLLRKIQRKQDQIEELQQEKKRIEAEKKEKEKRKRLKKVLQEKEQKLRELRQKEQKEQEKERRRLMKEYDQQQRTNGEETKPISQKLHDKNRIAKEKLMKMRFEQQDQDLQDESRFPMEQMRSIEKYYRARQKEAGRQLDHPAEVRMS